MREGEGMGQSQGGWKREAAMADGGSHGLMVKGHGGLDLGNSKGKLGTVVAAMKDWWEDGARSVVRTEAEKKLLAVDWSAWWGSDRWMGSDGRRGGSWPKKWRGCGGLGFPGGRVEERGVVAKKAPLAASPTIGNGGKGRGDTGLWWLGPIVGWQWPWRRREEGGGTASDMRGARIACLVALAGDGGWRHGWRAQLAAWTEARPMGMASGANGDRLGKRRTGTGGGADVCRSTALCCGPVSIGPQVKGYGLVL